MRAVVQVVDGAHVTVEDRVVGGFDGAGLLVLLGVTHDDTVERVESLARKIWEMRIMDDERSASDLGAPVLVVSQFTLYANTSKGRRPSWSAAAPGHVAEPLVASFVAALRALGAEFSAGVFGADMRITLVNDGPRTLILDN